VADGVHLTLFDGGVVNIAPYSRPLTADDVAALRAAVEAAGYAETGSWIATQGASWLSDGSKSVSLRIERAGRS
jgi:hypothetical protein